MSLNGLDTPDVVQAFASAVAEPAGWFLTKYASRDTVELLGKGSNGVSEARATMSSYEEKSPVYGLIMFRRKRVIIKYVPDGTSRLLQARTTVHFRDVQDKYSPYDSVLEITSVDGLSDTALAAIFPLHAGLSSVSTNQLDEITEDGEEPNSPAAARPVTATASAPSKFGRKAALDRMAAYKRGIPSIALDSSALTTKPSRSIPSSVPTSGTVGTGQDTSSKPHDLVPTDTNADATEATVISDGSRTAEGPSADNERLTPSTHLSDRSDDSKRNSFGARFDDLNLEELGIYDYKPKVKLAPRPVNLTDSKDSSQAASSKRSTSALPIGMKLKNRVLERSSLSPPGDRISEPRGSFESPQTAEPAPPETIRSILPPAPPVPDTIVQRPSNSAPSFRSVRSTATLGRPMTQEKQRLLKAVEMRKRQLKKAKRSSLAAESDGGSANSESTIRQEPHDVTDTPAAEPPLAEDPDEDSRASLASDLPANATKSSQGADISAPSTTPTTTTDLAAASGGPEDETTDNADRRVGEAWVQGRTEQLREPVPDTPPEEPHVPVMTAGNEIHSEEPPTRQPKTAEGRDSRQNKDMQEQTNGDEGLQHPLVIEDQTTKKSDSGIKMGTHDDGKTSIKVVSSDEAGDNDIESVKEDQGASSQAVSSSARSKNEAKVQNGEEASTLVVSTDIDRASPQPERLSMDEEVTPTGPKRVEADIPASSAHEIQATAAENPSGEQASSERPAELQRKEASSVAKITDVGKAAEENFESAPMTEPTPAVESAADDTPVDAGPTQTERIQDDQMQAPTEDLSDDSKVKSRDMRIGQEATKSPPLSSPEEEKTAMYESSVSVRENGRKRESFFIESNSERSNGRKTWLSDASPDKSSSTESLALNTSDARRKRRGVVAPLTLTTPALSSASPGSDELEYFAGSATVHEATPVPVVRNPISPTSPAVASRANLSTTDETTSGIIGSPGSSAVQRLRNTVLARSGNARQGGQNNTSDSPTSTTIAEDFVSSTKKVGSSISQRIAALAQSRSREGSPNSGPNALPSPPIAGAPGRLSRTLPFSNQSEQSSSSTTHPEVLKDRLRSGGVFPSLRQAPKKVFKAPAESQAYYTVHTDPNTKRESVSVTARIVKPGMQPEESLEFEAHNTQESGSTTEPTIEPPSQAYDEPAASFAQGVNPREPSIDSSASRETHESSRFGRFTSFYRGKGREKSHAAPGAGGPDLSLVMRPVRPVEDDNETIDTVVPRDKDKDTRRSRFLKRMSGLSTISTRRRPGTARSEMGPPPMPHTYHNGGHSIDSKPLPPEPPGGMSPDGSVVGFRPMFNKRDGAMSPLPPLRIGDLNVQFPGSGIWKRRYVEISAGGDIVFAANEKTSVRSRTGGGAGRDGNGRAVDLYGDPAIPSSPDSPVGGGGGGGGTKIYALRSFARIFVPQPDDMDLAYSVVLELDAEEGEVVVACEDARAQRELLSLLQRYHSASTSP